MDKEVNLGNQGEQMSDLSDSDIEIEPLRKNTMPPLKVDRHGFLVEHRLHDKVSSLPNPTLTTEIGQRREYKWLRMFENWDTFIRRNPNQLRRRCRKGIPQAVRSLAWQHMCGANKLEEQNPGLFDKLVESEEDSSWGDTIKKDIPRTFRHHCMFTEEAGQGAGDLYKVLVAFSAHFSTVGYNQALAPLAAVMLMHMPPNECFWVLVSVCKYYVPGYYGDKMEAMRLDGLIFDKLLQKHLPYIHRHMTANRIDPLMYIVEWFVCVFARCLPFQTVLRVWDMFFCEGVKALFKVALGILKLVFPNRQSLAGKDDFQTTQILLDLPKEVTLDVVLIPVALAFDINEKEFQRIHQDIYRENPELSISRYYSTNVKPDSDDSS